MLVSLRLLLPPATKLGQGNIFTGICDSVHRGGSASVHAGIPPQDQAGTSQDQAPPPQHQAHPPEQSILGDMVNEWAVCILLECNLVSLFSHALLIVKE